ncbi:cytochrome b [Ferrigenium sp. UT4]
MSTSPIARYNTTAMALHWLVALLVFATFPLGVYMHDLPLSPAKLQYYSYHKWIGVTIFLLVVIRVVWRYTHTPPPLPPATPRWEVVVSHITHLALYGLLLAIPLSGWLMSSAKGFQTVWFGVLPLPDLIGKDKALGELLTTVHQGLNLALFGLVGMHIAAVIKHKFIDHDQILERMLPKGKSK